MSARFGIGLIGLALGVTALGVVMMPTACTVLTNDAPPDDAGPFEAGEAGDASGATCTSCITQECTGIWSVCLLDGTCRTTAACMANDGILANCACTGATANDGGVDPVGSFLAFRSCSAAKTCTTCQSSCPTQPGRDLDCASINPGTPYGTLCVTSDAGDLDAGADADAAPPAPVTVDSCSSCVANRCGDPKKACVTGTECEQFLDCAYACKDTSCTDACGTRFTTGKESARELSDCVTTSCRDTCGL